MKKLIVLLFVTCILTGCAGFGMVDMERTVTKPDGTVDGMVFSSMTYGKEIQDASMVDGSFEATLGSSKQSPMEQAVNAMGAILGMVKEVNAQSTVAATEPSP